MPRSPRSDATGHDADPGPAALDAVRRELGVEDAWSVARDRTLLWWPGDLRVKVRMDPPRRSGGLHAVRALVMTDLLRPTPRIELLARAAAAVGRTASVWAIVLDPVRERDPASLPVEQVRPRLVSTVTLHARNASWAVPLLVHVVRMHAAESASLAPTLAEVLSTRLEAEEAGADPDAGTGGPVALDASGHPRSGRRVHPHEAVLAEDAFYRPRAGEGDPFPARDFAAAAEMQPTPSVETNASGRQLVAELPFHGDTGGGASLLGHLSGIEHPLLGTALLQLSGEEEHPLFGPGCLALLTLPKGLPEPGLLAELNRAEADARSIGLGLGAWCPGPQGITHACFLPDAAHAPGLIEQLILDAGLRAAWAGRFLA